jgi:hypothetical protein
MPETLDLLRDHHEQLRLRVDTFRLQQQVAAIESIEAQPRVVREAYGEPLSPQEMNLDGFGQSLFVRQTRIEDRKDGSFFPIYETETQLAEIRALARAVTCYTPEGHSIQQNLANYTLAKGYDYDVQGDGEIAAVAKAALVEFLDGNDWPAVEREFFLRSREDGESLLTLVPRGDNVRAKFVEPDQLREPANKRQLDEWLDLGIVPAWKYGVHTEEDWPSDPLGYHVVRDGAGSDWDYFPAADATLAVRLRSGLLEHCKLNVYGNAKRGVSDYYPVHDKIAKSDKLLGNMLAGGAIQAAIAWIVENAATTSAGDLANLEATRFTTYEQPRPKQGSLTRNVRHFPPGSIVETSAGRKYQPGPMGSQRAPYFVEMIQAGLRIVGARWSMPEYMISSDASNANYSSTLVAESPFIKGREHDQTRYALHFRRILWKVLSLLHAMGRLGNYSWEEIKQGVNVVVKPPKVATRDPVAQASVDQILVALGAKSVESVSTDHGLDYAAEVEKGAVQSLQQQPGAFDQHGNEESGEMGGLGRRQFKNNRRAMQDILDDLNDGVASREEAIELLVALGINRARAEKFVAARLEPTTESTIPAEQRTWLSHVAQKVRTLHASIGGP